MEQTFIAKTFAGLESVLAQELNELGAKDVKEGRRVVYFTGDKEMMYRANFSLHTAIRILKPIKTFRATSADEVYEEIMRTDWDEYLLKDKETATLGSFAVDAVVYSDDFRHSKYVAYKVKDAICDQFREKTGKRPNISIDNPDLRLHIHIADNEATLCLDSSGESLHKRGYRHEQVEAPLNEVLAAGMIMLTGWKGDCDLIDPMCGSGTILIEAALIAMNMSPGIFRKEFAFEKWPDFDAGLLEKIYNDDSREREFHHHIYGYDISGQALQKAHSNVKSAGLAEKISLEQKDFKDFEYNGKAQTPKRCILITNPPYGERISTTNLLNTYSMIGGRLKHQFTGCEAWILSYRQDCLDQIGLRPSVKFPLYNGSLECLFNKYQIFGGRLKNFRSEGGSIKTDEERRQMATRKFKSRKQQTDLPMQNIADEMGKIRTQQLHERWKQKQYLKRQLAEYAAHEEKDE